MAGGGAAPLFPPPPPGTSGGIRITADSTVRQCSPASPGWRCSTAGQRVRRTPRQPHHGVGTSCSGCELRRGADSTTRQCEVGHRSSTSTVVEVRLCLLCDRLQPEGGVGSWGGREHRRRRRAWRQKRVVRRAPARRGPPADTPKLGERVSDAWTEHPTAGGRWGPAHVQGAPELQQRHARSAGQRRLRQAAAAAACVHLVKVQILRCKAGGEGVGVAHEGPLGEVQSLTLATAPAWSRQLLSPRSGPFRARVRWEASANTQTRTSHWSMALLPRPEGLGVPEAPEAASRGGRRGANVGAAAWTSWSFIKPL